MIGGRAWHPDLVQVVERAIQITTQDFRVQEGLRTLIARGVSRTTNSRHLTGHAVDLVALGGAEISWVAATMQAAAHDLQVPVCWGGCWDLILAIASPQDSVADYVAACLARGRRRFLDGAHFELSRACRHD